MPKPTIYLGADHAGWATKEGIEHALRSDGFAVMDLGNQALVESDDYPDFAYQVAKQVAAHPGSFGILSCGNAEGVAIVANKVRGIRAAVVYSAFAVETTRTDDDANVACLPGRYMSVEDAIAMTRTFLATSFSAAERHRRRLARVSSIEEETMK